MTVKALLIICLAAQTLIAAGLGFFFLKRYFRKRLEGKNNPPSGGKTSDDKG